MRLLRRHKSVLIALGIYWPFIFWLTHIPVPEIARRSGMSDKTMHVLAYFLLTFLVWFAISPYQKVRWNAKKPWILLAVVLCYAAVDEILQGRVGRSMDFMDFIADAFGGVLALGLLSLLSFWPAMLTASGAFIFIISNKSHLLFLYPQYHLDTMFHYTAYTAFALIWIQCLDRYASLRSPSGVWLSLTLAGPIVLLAVVKGTGPLFDRGANWVEVATALFGIASALLSSYLTLYLTRKRKSTAA